MEMNIIEVEVKDNDANVVDVPVKKKRGRKPKPKPENPEPHIPKKRGRKPKGGKIITNPLEKSEKSEYITENVILHLKCNSEDIDINNDTNLEYIDDNIESFQEVNEVSSNNTILVEEPETNNEVEQTMVSSNNQLKCISDKLISLQKNLYYNDIISNNSACFWCTCEFDHSSIYIPKYKLNEKYHVYGCFCSPECAVAHLFNETLDNSIKFERYQLLNFLYNNIYNNVTNIKPAPNPFYLLDKFMGNMTINEYRSLLQQDRLFIVVDKPITRILPEIYEETDIKGSQFEILNTKTSFQIKRSYSNTTKPKFF
jgi:hypothetical protein